MSAKTTKT